MRDFGSKVEARMLSLSVLLALAGNLMVYEVDDVL